MRLPTFAQLQAFCERDFWTPKKQTHHIRYTKTIDGKLWRTRISFGAGQIEGPNLFAHILRDQLNVDHDEFWRVVESGGPARRPTAPVLVAQELSAWVVAGLLKEGVFPEELKSLTETDARDLLIKLRSRPRPERTQAVTPRKLGRASKARDHRASVGRTPTHVRVPLKDPFAP